MFCSVYEQCHEPAGSGREGAMHESQWSVHIFNVLFCGYCDWQRVQLVVGMLGDGRGAYLANVYDVYNIVDNIYGYLLTVVSLSNLRSTILQTSTMHFITKPIIQGYSRSNTLHMP